MSSEPAAPRRAHPALWVPSLYFAMGTPMTAVTAMSAVLARRMSGAISAGPFGASTSLACT